MLPIFFFCSRCCCCWSFCCCCYYCCGGCGHPTFFCTISDNFRSTWPRTATCFFFLNGHTHLMTNLSTKSTITLVGRTEKENWKCLTFYLLFLFQRYFEPYKRDHDKAEFCYFHFLKFHIILVKIVLEICYCFKNLAHGHENQYKFLSKHIDYS